jgi:hypothetical protein
MRTIFPTIFEIGTAMAQTGLDVIAAIESHNKALKSNVVLMNSSFLNPKRVEILGKIENVCTGL